MTRWMPLAISVHLGRAGVLNRRLPRYDISCSSRLLDSLDPIIEAGDATRHDDAGLLFARFSSFASNACGVAKASLRVSRVAC
jgi:hypothetical protein